jgi:hypothetical protein
LSLPEGNANRHVKTRAASPESKKAIRRSSKRQSARYKTASQEALIDRRNSPSQEALTGARE